MAACSPQIPESRPSETTTKEAWGTQASLVDEPPTDGFVGNAACQPCHAVNFESHTHSRHMQTLREGTRTALAGLAPPLGPLPGVGTVTWDQDQLLIEAPNKDTGAPVPVPIDLVLGSGKTGMTYLAIHDQGSLEIRQSFFPHEKKFHVTPGQEEFATNVVGQTHTLPDAIRCVGCHSVATPSAGPLPEKRFYGVGCESCHGAGAKHVVARQALPKTPFSRDELVVLRGAGGARLNAVCGKCHRTPEKVATLDKLAQQATNRFQPYGLSLSKCFKKSNDTLSCATCHNPHKDASTNPKEYEKTCLSCHSAPQKACPVNPKEKCVSCHMPTKPVFPGTPFPITMADHFIRVYKDGKPTR
jgi:Cytochrome c3